MKTSRSAVIKKETSPYRRPKESNPEPGQYDRHLTKFGSNGKKFSIGLPAKWKPDENPPVGGYNPLFYATQPMNKSAIIKSPVSPYRRPKESFPEPGQYTGHLTPFGADAKKIDFGNKYIFKVDRNPKVGYYSPNHSLTKSKSISTVIKTPKNTSPQRTIFPKKNEPSTDKLRNSISSFGTGKSFTIGTKREEPYKRTPAVGEYDVDKGLNMTKESIKGGSYIAADNAFETRNSFLKASLEKNSRYANKYLLKNMSPDSRDKVYNLNK